MNLIASAPGWLAAILLLLLLLAALEDMWRLEIHDGLSAAVALGAFVSLGIDGPVSGVWQNLLLFAMVLGVGTMVHSQGWMGGGDIKLLAASALWLDLAQGWKLLVAVAVAGGIETLFVMLLRLPSWPDRLRRRLALLRRDEDIPYAVAIAAGMAIIGCWARA